LKKSAKKLLLTWGMGRGGDNAHGGESQKFFCFFFFKKRSACFTLCLFRLTSLMAGLRDRHSLHLDILAQSLGDLAVAFDRVAHSTGHLPAA
jgi:hypothetical protein